MNDDSKQPSSVSNVFKNVRKYIEYYLEKILRTVFFWEKDDRRLGLILRTVHNIFIISILSLYIFNHTIFPSIILLFGIWMMSTLIFLFHLLTGGCLCTKLEHKLTGERVTIVDPILEIFHIPITKETVKGITILGSSVFFTFTTLEVLFHTIVQCKAFFSLIF
jgi:hypothetical protein